MNFHGFDFEENIRTYLQELDSSGRLPHALLIESSDTKASMDLAVFLSMFAVCSEKTGKPCGECKNCRNARGKTHPDITYPQLNPKKKSYEVDQIRDIIKDAYIIPNEADAKVYIFEHADVRLTKQTAAQNAFLKLAEEPPQNVYFILLCESAQALLPTILSRFTIIHAGGFRREDESVTAAANSICTGLLDSREYPLLKSLTALNDKDKAPAVLEAVRRTARDALAVLAGGKTLGDKELAGQLSARLTRKKLIDIMELCGTAALKIQQNANNNLLITWLCGEFRRIIWQR